MVMDNAFRPMEILLIEDSPSDAQLAIEALGESCIECRITLVCEGDEAVRYLLQQGSFADAPRPDVILLDLNLPGVDGRSVLRTIASDFMLQMIPVVVMTSSPLHEDRIRSEHLQVAGYMVKPVDLDKFVALVKTLADFWGSDILLPAAAGDAER